MDAARVVRIGLLSGLVFVLLAFGRLAEPGATPVHWQLTLLARPAGYFGCVATAVNDQGQILGRCWRQNRPHAFLWEGGKPREISVERCRSLSIDPFALNNRGQVLGSCWRYPDIDNQEKVWDFVWQGGRAAYPGFSIRALNNRGEVIGSAGGRGVVWKNGRTTYIGSVEPAAINDHGVVVGAGVLHGKHVAFVWQNGRITSLGKLGGYSSSATALNEQGDIVGASNRPHGEGHAVLWRHGKIIDLGTLGGDWSRALAINEHGWIVGWAWTRPNDDQSTDVFLWRSGQMINLTHNPRLFGEPLAINDRGQVLLSVGGTGNDHAVVWEEGRSTSLGPTSRASAINNHGQIVGSVFRGRTSYPALWTSR